jgi:hypothetical protein
LVANKRQGLELSLDVLEEVELMLQPEGIVA